jgi:hypothetical protein
MSTTTGKPLAEKSSAYAADADPTLVKVIGAIVAWIVFLSCVKVSERQAAKARAALVYSEAVVGPAARYSPRPGRPPRSAKDAEALVSFFRDFTVNPERHGLFGRSRVDGCEAVKVQPAGRSEAPNRREDT